MFINVNATGFNMGAPLLATSSDMHVQKPTLNGGAPSRLGVAFSTLSGPNKFEPATQLPTNHGSPTACGGVLHSTIPQGGN